MKKCNYEHKKRIYLRKNEKEKIKRDIEHLVCWLEQRYRVYTIFDSDVDNEYDSDEKMITVNNKANYRSQLHTLIHETGHVKMMTNKNIYKSQFPIYGKNKNKKSKSYKVESIREEVMAWEEGLKIAKRIGIEINEEWFNKHRVEALWTYLTWATGK